MPKIEQPEQEGANRKVLRTVPCGSYGRPACMGDCEEVEVLEETGDDGVIVERVAAVDISKGEVVCCVRVPRAGWGGTAGTGGAYLRHNYPLAHGDGPTGWPGWG